MLSEVVINFDFMNKIPNCDHSRSNTKDLNTQRKMFLWR